MNLKGEDELLVQPVVSNHAGVLSRVSNDGVVDDDDGASLVCQRDYLHPGVITELDVSNEQLILLSSSPWFFGPKCLK